MPVLGPPLANANIVNQNVAGFAPALPSGTPTVKNFADSAAVYEYSYSTGVGPYELAGAYGGYFPFGDAYQDGDTVYYRVTDGSARTEFAIGIFNAAAKTISRDTIIQSSNQGAAINWVGRTRLLIHALVPGLPLCTDVPQDGDVLTWVQAQDLYCPEVPTGGGGGGGGNNVFYISFSYGSTFQFLPSDPFDDTLEIFDLVAPVAITFPANLSTSPTPICEVAPTTDVQLNIESYIGAARTPRGTLTYATGSTTGTYTFTSFTLATGGRLRLYIDPINDDGVIAGIAGTIAGTH